MKSVFQCTSPEDRVVGTSSMELYAEQKLVLLDVGFAGVSSVLMTFKVGSAS